METRFHTQEVVESPNPHQNRKDNPPQELRCGRAHVGNIGDQGHHQGYPRPAGHGGEGALDPQRKLKQGREIILKDLTMPRSSESHAPRIKHSKRG